MFAIAYERTNLTQNDTEKKFIGMKFLCKYSCWCGWDFLNENFHAHVSIHYCDDEKFAITDLYSQTFLILL